MRSRLQWLLPAAALLLAALGACRPVPAPPPAAAEARTPLPEPAPGSRRFAISAERSEVRILVYRAGPLAAFGHNHVIRAARIGGEVHVAPDPRRSVLSLELPVAAFEVDAPGARALEGEDFAEQPSAQAVAQTRENLLGPAVLDAAKHPEIRVHSLGIVGPDRAPEVLARVEIRGVQREVAVPLALELGDRQLAAAGSISVNQSDFGIQPFSVLGGGLRVADTLTLRFRIVAEAR